MSKHTTTPPPASASEAPTMTDARALMMTALSRLCDRTNPMEPDRARAIAQVASVLVDTAKVEVDYLRATHQDCAEFLDARLRAELPNGIKGVTVHRISDREPG